MERKRGIINHKEKITYTLFPSSRRPLFPPLNFHLLSSTPSSSHCRYSQPLSHFHSRHIYFLQPSNHFHSLPFFSFYFIVFPFVAYFPSLLHRLLPLFYSLYSFLVLNLSSCSPPSTFSPPNSFNFSSCPFLGLFLSSLSLSPSCPLSFPLPLSVSEMATSSLTN